ncbi:hypothetical protein BKA67DRAFT_570289 [Truncatella angustata]|uniref:Uncharacterized protein n=1 Tax=Truncatella angustata TaxID=152316 RepID=A0A9P8UJX0_9PEZI|nr:uncharacterized protein BKA67DRAFT_570289 [Truncatella angustata]KAH6653562.1 hypothetical protein BKA67DRAFT_570289 [Truncatella angustata]
MLQKSLYINPCRKLLLCFLEALMTRTGATGTIPVIAPIKSIFYHLVGQLGRDRDRKSYNTLQFSKLAKSRSTLAQE